MNTVPREILRALLLLGIVTACEFPLGDSPLPGGPGPATEVRFLFDTPQDLPVADGVRVPITSVMVSYQAEGSDPVERQRLAVETTEVGYTTAPLALPGSIVITELFALDDFDQAYGVIPTIDSSYGNPEFSPQTVPFTLNLSGGAQTANVAFKAVGYSSEPADYGYESFPPTRVVQPMDLSYRAVNEEGVPIPSFLHSRTLRTTSGGSGSSSHWGYNPLGNPEPRLLYGGLQLSGPKGYQSTGQMLYASVKIGAYGYEDSPDLYFFPSELDSRRSTNPVVDIVLKAESTLVKLVPAGVNDAGLRIVKARLAVSQFIERAQQDAGATEADKYQYTIGFTLGGNKPRVINGQSGWITENLLVSPAPSSISSTFYPVPYNKNLAQSRDAYRTLEADLIIKNEAAWADFNNPELAKLMQVYVEVLMLKGDGTGTIDGDEEFLGFSKKVIKVGPQQIEVESP